MRKKKFRAWVVRWCIREDKVKKSTGTVITLLPSRYGPETVRKIVEALYCAYACTYDGQAEYGRSRSKDDSLSQTTFDGRVEIGQSPGLSAVLAEDVSVKVISPLRQIISWTDPDYYEPTLEQPRFRKCGSGEFHKLEFNYSDYAQTEVT